MKTILFNYLCVVLVLCVVYQYIPKRKVEIENIYLFVGSGLVIYFLYDRIIARENFEAEVVAPVAPEVVAPVAPEVVAPVAPEVVVSVAPEVVVSVEPTLSDREILDHVQTIIKNIKNEANLKKIYETSKEIISDTINDPDWIQFDKLYENDLDIKIVKVNSSTIVYVITDNKIGLDKKPYTYRFAVKYDL